MGWSRKMTLPRMARPGGNDVFRSAWYAHCWRSSVQERHVAAIATAVVEVYRTAFVIVSLAVGYGGRSHFGSNDGGR